MVEGWEPLGNTGAQSADDAEVDEDGGEEGDKEEDGEEGDKKDDYRRLFVNLFSPM